jgi:general secretion pathway protein F
MPTFRYKAFEGSGAETSGLIAAESEKQAALKLKEQGIYVREITSEKAPSRKADPSALPSVTRELALLVATGVPLVDSLKTISGAARGRWRWILERIVEDVSSGMSFSRALVRHSAFPVFYSKMAATGEASGTLDKALESLADFLDAEAETASKIKSALYYPAFMLAVGTVVLAFIFGFVLPRIARIFEDSGEALPLVTRALMGASNLFISYWWAMLLALALCVYGFRAYYRKKRRRIDSMLLRLPVMRGLYLARFTRAFGFLLEGGVPVVRALELAGPSSGNLAIEGMSREAMRGLSEGADVAQALQGFPPVFVQLLATGQKSGRLAEAVKRAARSYDEDFRRRLGRALAMVEPSLILIMGAAVAFIVVAVLLPIFELNQIIR